MTLVNDDGWHQEKLFRSFEEVCAVLLQAMAPVMKVTYESLVEITTNLKRPRLQSHGDSPCLPLVACIQKLYRYINIYTHKTTWCVCVSECKMIIQREAKDLNPSEHISKYIHIMNIYIYICVILLYDKLINLINHHHSITRWDRSYPIHLCFNKHWIRTELPKNLVPSPRKPNRPKGGGVLPDVFGVDGMGTAWRCRPL